MMQTSIKLVVFTHYFFAPTTTCVLNPNGPIDTETWTAGALSLVWEPKNDPFSFFLSLVFAEQMIKGCDSVFTNEDITINTWMVVETTTSVKDPNGGNGTST